MIAGYALGAPTFLTTCTIDSIALVAFDQKRLLLSVLLKKQRRHHF